jgi:hypothetical protein
VTALLLAAALSWAGWAALTPVPVALALSQMPAAAWLLGWLLTPADRAVRRGVLLAQAAAPRPRPRHAAPAPAAREDAEPVVLASVASLDEHRARKRAA